MGKWDHRFMDMAALVSTWSKDPSTKVGAVLTSGKDVISLGYNGFPPGTRDTDEIYNDRPRKYLRVIHAEANALLMASRKADDMILYTTLCPCSQCAAMAIRFGVKSIMTPVPTVEQISRWGDSFEQASEMLAEAGVQLIYLHR